MPRPPQQLDDVPSHARSHAQCRVRSRAAAERRLRGEPHHLQPDPGVRDPGRDVLVADRPVVSRQRQHGLELPLESELLAEGGHSALHVERAHRDPPPVPGSPDHAGRHRVGEEHLVELRSTGELHDRPHLYAGLPHRNQKAGQAPMPFCRKICTAQHEAPVRELGQRRPHLLAGHTPLPAVEHSPGPQPGQIRAGLRLGVSLAPHLGPGQDRGQEPGLLFRRPEHGQRGPEQLLTDVPDPAGRAGSRVLLVEDHLLRPRQPAPAIFRWPADAYPAARPEPSLPGQPLLHQLVLTPRPALSHQPGELARQLRGEPPAHLVTEFLIGHEEGSRRSAFSTWASRMERAS